MSSLEHGRFCQEVVNQTGLLVATLEGAELSATVPTAPDWSLSDLVRHVGGNLRSVEQAVRTGEPVTDPEGQVEEHFGPAGGDPAPLFAWLTEAAGRFASTLGAAGPGPAGSIHLHATDTGPEVPSEWLIELGSPTFTWRHAHERATAAVRGPVTDVLRVAYRRLPPDADGIEVLGDREVLDGWLERMRLQ